MASEIASLKRKRDDEETEELEIDVNLPEPLSKKALRKAKKSKDQGVELAATDEVLENGDSKEEASAKPEAGKKENSRSEWGIWIGNLPWTVGKNEVREFLCKDTSIEDKHITRVHMPAPSSKGDDSRKTKPKNKGFAYVDFDAEEHLQAALKLSETLLLGRRVLIKNSRSFEGRPEKEASDGTPKALSGKPPNKRIFVGNLSFDITSEDLERHFGKCGEVTHVHVATFEDSGKCKGFAWVTFEDIEAATSAVRGWVSADAETEGEKKTKKIWVNKIQGRPLRCEFAEDASLRYSKRFGKGGRKSDDGEGEVASLPIAEQPQNEDTSTAHDRRRAKRQAGKSSKDNRESWRKAPIADSKPAKATGAMIEGTGKKVSFD